MHDNQAPWTTYEDPDVLFTGLSHNGVTIRYPKDHEKRHVLSLARLAVDGRADQEHLEQIFNGGALVRAFAHRNAPAAEHIQRNLTHPSQLVAAGTVVLVAEVEGRVHAMTSAGIPTAILDADLRSMASFDDHLQNLRVNSSLAWSRVAKLLHLAVDPEHQHHGLGTALGLATMRLFELAQYGILFGQCAPHLKHFYESLGCDVSDHGKTIDITEQLGLVKLLTTSNEDLTFVRRYAPADTEVIKARTPWLTPHLGEATGPREYHSRWITAIADGAPYIYICPVNPSMANRGFLDAREGDVSQLPLTATLLRQSGDDLHLCIPDTTRSPEESSLQAFDDLATSSDFMQAIHHAGGVAVLYTEEFPKPQSPLINEHVRHVGIVPLHRSAPLKGSSFYRQ